MKSAMLRGGAIWSQSPFLHYSLPRSPSISPNRQSVCRFMAMVVAAAMGVGCLCMFMFFMCVSMCGFLVTLHSTHLRLPRSVCEGWMFEGGSTAGSKCYWRASERGTGDEILRRNAMGCSRASEIAQRCFSKRLMFEFRARNCLIIFSVSSAHATPVMNHRRCTLF